MIYNTASARVYWLADQILKAIVCPTTWPGEKYADTVFGGPYHRALPAVGVTVSDKPGYVKARVFTLVKLGGRSTYDLVTPGEMRDDARLEEGRSRLDAALSALRAEKSRHPEGGWTYTVQSAVIENTDPEAILGQVLKG